MPSLHMEEISLASFQAVLSRYTDTAPSALSELDTLRYDSMPAKVQKDAALQKADVEKLVEWKLKHGTYRPALLSLVKSNPAALIQSTTYSAFAALRNDGDVPAALKVLTQLRGIGPATASLLLSVAQPDAVPFFADELFRWARWEAPGRTGWGRSIRYSVAEYRELLGGVRALRERLGVAAVEAEMVAYVLGREGVDVGVDDDVGVDEHVKQENKKGEFAVQVQVQVASNEPKEPVVRSQKTKKTKTKQKHPQPSTKRKALEEEEEEEEDSPAETLRRSTRRRIRMNE